MATGYYCGWASESLHHQKDGSKTLGPINNGINHLSAGDLDFATIHSRTNSNGHDYHPPFNGDYTD